MTSQNSLEHLLIEKNYIQPEQLAQARQLHKQQGGDLGEVLLALNFLTIEQLFEARRIIDQRSPHFTRSPSRSAQPAIRPGFGSHATPHPNSASYSHQEHGTNPEIHSLSRGYSQQYGGFGQKQGQAQPSENFGKPSGSPPTLEVPQAKHPVSGQHRNPSMTNRPPQRGPLTKTYPENRPPTGALGAFSGSSHFDQGTGFTPNFLQQEETTYPKPTQTAQDNDSIFDLAGEGEHDVLTITSEVMDPNEPTNVKPYPLPPGSESDSDERTSPSAIKLPTLNSRITKCHSCNAPNGKDQKICLKCKHLVQPPNKNDLLYGRVFGDRFKLNSRIGLGGMGMIYHAQDLRTEDFVAIKLLPIQFNTDERIIKRFTSEARIQYQLHHPNIIHTIGFGFEEEIGCFLAMELLIGDDFASFLEEHERLDPQQILFYFSQLCDALHYAHQQSVIHRDLKPSNLFLAQSYGSAHPQLKVFDFGIAKLLSEHTASLTFTGMVVGTPKYMSPEQAHGEKSVDHRSDIYSIGIILFLALTGSLPFAKENVTDTLLAQIYKPPPTLAQIQPSVSYPPELQDFMDRVLAKDRELRPRSALEFKQELHHILSGVDINEWFLDLDDESPTIRTRPTMSKQEAPVHKTGSSPVAPHIENSANQLLAKHNIPPMRSSMTQAELFIELCTKLRKATTKPMPLSLEKAAHSDLHPNTPQPQAFSPDAGSKDSEKLSQRFGSDSDLSSPNHPAPTHPESVFASTGPEVRASQGVFSGGGSDSNDSGDVFAAASQTTDTTAETKKDKGASKGKSKDSDKSFPYRKDSSDHLDGSMDSEDTLNATPKDDDETTQRTSTRSRAHQIVTQSIRPLSKSEDQENIKQKPSRIALGILVPILLGAIGLLVYFFVMKQ